MASSRDIWRSLSPLSKVIAIGVAAAAVFAVAVVVVLAGGLSRPQTAGAPSPSTAAVASNPPLPPTESPAPLTTPAPTPTPPPPGADPLLGTDGRLTVLLLGSDYRPSHPGNRTDAIIVVSVDPTTGESAGFSVPRDVAGFPLPEKGTYAPKVNGLFPYLQSHGGQAGARMKKAVSRAFGIEVDRYAFIGFHGVKALVTAVGGVDITLARPYYDPYYWVNARQQGWGLPAGRSHLNGENALIFARSRKGDSDFGRARRQQMLILAALEKTRKRGPAGIAKLVTIARSTVRTDLPLERAADLFRLFSTVDISKVDRAVFGPKTFAYKTQGTDYRLRLEACRAWISRHFPAIRPFGTWPIAAPIGSPTPTPSTAAPTPSPAPS